jgi:hypothetical protein
MGAGVVLALLAAAAMPPSMVGDRAAPFVMLIPFCGVGLLVRRLIIPYELRRIDFASGVLQELDVGAQTQVALMLDLAQTTSPRFKTSTEGQGGATRYVMHWLRLESVVASGDRFALIRSELCDRSFQYQRDRKKHVVKTRTEFEDTITLQFPTARSWAPPPRPAEVPDGLSWRALSVTPTGVEIKVAGWLRWGVPGGAGVQDALEVTRQFVRTAAAIAERPSPLGTATRAAPGASLPWIGRRGFAVVLALLSTPLLVGVAMELMRVRYAMMFRPNELPLFVQLSDAFVLAAPALLLLIGATLLWRRPRVRA